MKKESACHMTESASKRPTESDGLHLQEKSRILRIRPAQKTQQVTVTVFCTVHLETNETNTESYSKGLPTHPPQPTQGTAS